MPKVDLGTFPNQSLVILLALLNFLLLFVQLCVIIICFHPRPFQHTSPQYVRLDVQLTDVPQLQTRSSTLTKKLHSCAVPFVFSCQAPCQASFRPVPLGFKLGLPFGRLRFFFPFFKKIQQWVSDHHHHHHHHHHYHHHQQHHHHHEQQRRQQQQHQHHHDIS